MPSGIDQAELQLHEIVPKERVPLCGQMLKPGDCQSSIQWIFSV
jgi:hypothetical protein